MTASLSRRPLVLFLAFGLCLAPAGACRSGVGDDDSAGDDSPEDDTSGDDTSDDDNADGPPPGSPTFWNDVAPILTKNCLACHVDGGIAPMPLGTYDEVLPYAASIRSATEDREMPPWNLDNSGECNTYSNALWLSDEDIETIGAWVDAGSWEGESENPGEPPKPPTLDRVDLSLDIGAEYVPQGEGEHADDEYRCFVLRPDLPEDRFATAYEIVPGEPRVVHHVALYRLLTYNELAMAIANDASEPGPGYRCFGGPGVGDAHFMGLWFPGMGAQTLPDNSGLRILADLGVILQVHYNLENGPMPDRTRMDLTLEDSVEREGVIYTLSNFDLELPPGEDLVEQTYEYTIPIETPDAKLWGVVPHMHLLGDSQRLEVIRGNESSCLVDVPRWDFHWHAFAMYTEPIELRGGDTLRLTCGYDTTGETETTVYGEGTHDEMCVTWMYLTES
ncbi:MAG: monooxygenase [Deltaproteobacteria bacterium]|nr:monooxygenase [Deltaproteobacteria bacterium]